jgi:hypothetical protein
MTDYNIYKIFLNVSRLLNEKCKILNILITQIMKKILCIKFD